MDSFSLFRIAQKLNRSGYHPNAMAYLFTVQR